MICTECNGPPHPIVLDLEEVRKVIPHTLGEHRPNIKGFLLCNGHCGWGCGECDSPTFLCLSCGYLECNGCAEDFVYEIEDKVVPDLEGHGTAIYCRGCGSHNAWIELNIKEHRWLMILLGIAEEDESDG